MQVQLHQFRQVNGSMSMVTFESPLGWGTAQWVGQRPEEGARRQVELAVPGMLTWGYEVAGSPHEEEAIFEEEGRVCLVGRVRWSSEDGVTAVKLGNDLVLVGIANAPALMPTHLLLRVPRLQLFDVLACAA
ncbi:hypothetical protein [Roseateles depolymerans]|uniref:Uncharacterized protein n=1 Tax=Roseateles depolymerans TaxID=76731 RepID=A0A0U3MRK1_9BURK|nr:hypothetical protein [Roseateles depolymerans]ALV06922.1 hypothetical protein RD2015_2454 [Roseateles depolymerans]REG19902.1 hypothetical protein DES44_2408 [Roseateles depolymerans]